MKNDIADILFKYTTGEATLEETNDALKEALAAMPRRETPQDRTRRAVYATGNRWAIENFEATHH